MDEAITYSKIRDIQREENGKNIFHKLPEGFVEQLQTYIKEKKELLDKNKDKNNVFSQDLYNRVEHEIKNALRAIESIFYARQKKIIDKAFLSAKTSSKIELKNLLDFEKRLYEKVYKIMNEYKKDYIIKILEGKNFKRRKDSSKNKENNNMLIRMLEKVPKFRGNEKKVLGPFKKGDVVNINKDVASFLVKKGKAEKI